jgi:release factor glutamine methyltransferase
MTRKELSQLARNILSTHTDGRELDAMIRLIWEHLSEKGKDLAKAESILARIQNGEPLQYILGSSWFYGYQFIVNSSVLIPRPETEELVRWVVEDYKNGCLARCPAILDIGTGSGCIAIVLNKKIPGSTVQAIDDDNSSLQTAKANALKMQADIRFERIDFLNWDPDESMDLDVIVSNPPYIPMSEMHQMDGNVIHHEPHRALFTTDTNALIFYHRIAAFSLLHLKKGGAIYLELNEFRTDETLELFVRDQFEPTLQKDMQGKYRMLRLVKH